MRTADSGMAPLRRLVVDVLKPHEPPLVQFADRVAEVDVVEAVRVSLIELDQEVQNVELTVEGSALGYDAVEDAIEGQGGSIHSVDEVARGEYVVDGRPDSRDD